MSKSTAEQYAIDLSQDLDPASFATALQHVMEDRDEYKAKLDRLHRVVLDCRNAGSDVRAGAETKSAAEVAADILKMAGL